MRSTPREKQLVLRCDASTARSAARLHRRLLSTLLTLIGVALAPLPSASQPGGPPGPSPLERAIESVELPPEVRSQIDALLDVSHSSRRGLHRELRGAREEMRELLEADDPQEDAILAQAEVIGRLQVSLEKDRLMTLLRIRALLTPQQRDSLTAALELRMQRRRERRPPPH